GGPAGVHRRPAWAEGGVTATVKMLGTTKVIYEDSEDAELEDTPPVAAPMVVASSESMFTTMDPAQVTPDVVMLEQVAGLLARAVKVEDVKKICDQATAAANFLRSQKAGEQVIADTTEIMVRAERRLGELLREMEKSGARASGKGRRPKVSQAATLPEMGIT